MRTFIHHDGALGDTLLSLPCFSALKTDSAAMHIAGRKDVVEFLREAGVVDSCISSDHAVFASLYSGVDNALTAFLAGFDSAYVFTATDDSPPADSIRSIIPETHIIRTVPPDGLKIHTAEYRLSQLAPDLPLSAKRALSLPEGHLREAQSLLSKASFESGKKLIAVHPGSGGKSKCWPLERYFDLVNRLQSAYDAFIVIFSGPAEDRELKKRIDAFARMRTGILHAADFKLMAAAAILSLCDLSIGNDSGFMHLAAMSSPVIVLFGPTDPLLWKPSGRNVEVISNGSLDQISLDAVIEKAGPVISSGNRTSFD